MLSASSTMLIKEENKLILIDILKTLMNVSLCNLETS